MRDRNDLSWGAVRFCNLSGILAKHIKIIDCTGCRVGGGGGGGVVDGDGDSQNKGGCWITLCQLLEVVVTEGLKNTGWSLGDGDGLSLPRGDARRRDRGGAAVLRRASEDLSATEKGAWGDSLWARPAPFAGGGRRSTFLYSSIRISTTIFWNLMSSMAATVSTWALISVGPKITAMLEGVIRLVSLWLHTLWTHTELSSLGGLA